MPARLRAALAIASAGAYAATAASAAAPLLMGGDVSLLPFIESRGGTFRDGGVAAPAERIMVNHGANTFRLRLFVNPNLDYGATSGAIQDLDSTVALAQRIKRSGAKVLLDFHYSDTWADPGHQSKPAAWSSLSGEALRTRVRDYTRESLQAFRAAGAMPDLVQVGNETTNGMLWPTGQVVYSGTTAQQNASWAAFGGLLNAGISGVRDVDAQTGKHTAIAIHVDGGDISGRAPYYFNKLATVGGVSPTSYDIAGLSYYPTSSGAMANLQGNMQFAATTLGRQVMVLETNSPWKGAATGSGFASTATGQRDFLVSVRDAVRALPNERGLGVLWWYPEAIQVSGTFIWKGGAIAMFDDTGGDALPSIDAMQLPAPTWAVNADGAWSASANWAGGVGGDGGTVARFGTAITTPRTITLDGPRTVAGLRFQNASSSYTIAGSAPLTLSNGAHPSGVDVLEGGHSIAAPVSFNGTGEVNVAWTSTLSLTQPMTAQGGLTKLGSGTLTLSGGRVQGTLDVNFGTVRLAPRPSASPVASMIVGGLEVAPLATLDLTNHTLAISPAGGAATEAMAESVRQALVAARIVSSLATANLAVGYAVDPSAERVAFDGSPIPASSLVLRLTLRGDADIDGDVDFADLVSLARAYNASGTIWQRGDFNYDGNTNFADLVLLAQRYGGTMTVTNVGTASFRSDWALAQAIVPEPCMLLLLPLALLGGRRRNPRKLP